MKLLIADDCELILDSLKALIETRDGWSAQTALNGEEALEACRKSPPDVVLMDIRMPVCDGVQAARNIKSEFPEVKIIMLTTFCDEEYIASAIEAGAEGYLLKDAPVDGIIERINAVFKGAQVFDKGVKLSAKKTNAELANFEELTKRENEILVLVASGLSNAEIAGKLFLSSGTIRNAVSAILEKLNLRDRTQLAAHYWKKIYNAEN